MINFLHTFAPEALLLEIGSLRIYWYGLFIVSGILLGMIIVLRLAEKYRISKEVLIDLVFYLVIFGIIGARIYHVFLELGYYRANPIAIFKIWEGGLAIHGAILAGLFVIYFFCKKRQLRYFQILAIFAPAVAAGQALGRWGNYFNQELYGLPTDLPWCITIDFAHRSLEHYSSAFFHPTFLYESLGSAAIVLLLLAMHRSFLKHDRTHFEYIVIVYLGLYSILRFCLEFVRIDRTPEFMGLRWPQIISLLILLVIIGFFVYTKKFKNTKNRA